MAPVRDGRHNGGSAGEARPMISLMTRRPSCHQASSPISPTLRSTQTANIKSLSSKPADARAASALLAGRRRAKGCAGQPPADILAHAVARGAFRRPGDGGRSRRTRRTAFARGRPRSDAMGAIARESGRSCIEDVGSLSVEVENRLRVSMDVGPLPLAGQVLEGRHCRLGDTE